MRKLHTPEWVKNLLLIGLSLSAVYLFTLSPLYLNSPLYGWTGRLRPAGPDAAGEAQPVNEARWRQALADEGIYFDFAGSVPLSALAGWLREGEKNGLLSGDARRMVLAAGEHGAVGFLQDDQDKKTFYGRATALQTQAHLTPVTASFAPNGAKFAFEVENLAACGPYTLIVEGTVSAPVYAAA